MGEIFCKHIHTWVRHTHSARSFPYLIEQLCLKAVPALKSLPKIAVKDQICTMTGLNCMINLHKNKAERKRLKSKKMETIVENKEMEVDNDEEEREKEKQTPLVHKRKGKDEGSGSKKQEKKPRAKESKDPFPLAIFTPHVAQTTKTTYSLSKSPTRTPTKTTLPSQEHQCPPKFKL